MSHPISTLLPGGLLLVRAGGRLLPPLLARRRRLRQPEAPLAPLLQPEQPGDGRSGPGGPGGQARLGLAHLHHLRAALPAAPAGDEAPSTGAASEAQLQPGHVEAADAPHRGHRQERGRRLRLGGRRAEAQRPQARGHPAQPERQEYVEALLTMSLTEDAVIALPTRLVMPSDTIDLTRFSAHTIENLHIEGDDCTPKDTSIKPKTCEIQRGICD